MTLSIFSDFDNKFKQIIGKSSFLGQFEKSIKLYQIVRHSIYIMRPYASLVIKVKRWQRTGSIQSSTTPDLTITVYSYGFLLNCTRVGQALDSLTTKA